LSIRAQRVQVTELRERIRDIRETLVSASSSPSIEAISERIRLQERIGRIEAQQQVFEDYMSELAQLANEWLDVQERFKKLPKGALSEQDEKKIGTLQSSFQRQLTQYKMGSLANTSKMVLSACLRSGMEKSSLASHIQT